MAGMIQSPLDVKPLLASDMAPGQGASAFDPSGMAGGPPIVPDVTQLGPEVTRSILQAIMANRLPTGAAMGEEDDEDEEEPLSIGTAMTGVTKLAVAAMKTNPDLINIMIAQLRLVRSAMAGEGSGMSGVGPLSVDAMSTPSHAPYYSNLTPPSMMSPLSGE